MLIRGGENVYPREIEEFLFTTPPWPEVQVFGVPDEKFGEEVCAWVRLNPMARNAAKTTCARSARAASRTTRSRATSCSWTPFR